ncbi:MAG: hypothetical protein IPN77_30000 [Sandaracinaceae bacterium]|nr:hypothetical protein [Sandaracinaceae bacterium]
MLPPIHQQRAGLTRLGVATEDSSSGRQNLPRGWTMDDRRMLVLVCVVLVGCGSAGARQGSQGVETQEPSAASTGGEVGVIEEPTSILTSAERERTMRLCAWNVMKLGHGHTTDLEAVAGVIDTHCDIAVVVEVMQLQGGHPGYDRLVEHLQGWEGLVTDSPRPRTSSGSAEYYAVVWRSASGVSVCDGWTDGLVFVDDNDGSGESTESDHFAREPAYVCLEHRRAGVRTTDFLLAAYHATWSDGRHAVIAEEAQQLAQVVESMRSARPGEEDVFVMGDFNLVPDRLAAATELADRTVGTGSTLNREGDITRNLYDHLLVADVTASRELRGYATVLDVRGVVDDPVTFRTTVSDHLPIVVTLSVAGPDDD